MIQLSQISILAQPVIVEAGESSAVCHDGVFNLLELNASISGDVTDGQWLSSGDGFFMPGYVGIGEFSSSTQYIPGSLDLQLGGFFLTLVSDAHPVSGLHYTDQVYVDVLNNVQPFCNGALNVSLDGSCETIIGYQQLVINPNAPLDLYLIELYDENGTLIEGTSLNHEHVGQQIQYVVTHECSGQSCEGMITVSDYFVPTPVCNDTILSCLLEVVPDSLGFPVQTDSIPMLIDHYTYHVENGDNCFDLYMSYSDHTEVQDCASPYERIITRSWSVWDENENYKYCEQLIYLERADLLSIQFPLDRDGILAPYIVCNDSIPLDENGNPHPSFSGQPDAMNCQFLESTYDDISIDFCGSTKKIIRSWHIIEWCSSIAQSDNQLIVTIDTLAPEINCLDSLWLDASSDACYSESQYIAVPIASDDCSSFEISLKIFKEGLQIFQIYNIPDQFVMIPELGLGEYVLDWKALDACSNARHCESILTVEDNTAPFMVCLQETQVAIGWDGTARVFAESVDLGSYDNCELVDLSIRKLEDICGDDTEFAGYVDLCCEEVGDTIIVILRATDHVGMTNFCEIEILVEDKIAPQIYCPSDLTISCESWFAIHDLNQLGRIRSDQDSVENIIIYDAFNDGIVGTDGFYVDNCGAEISQYSIENFVCDEGIIERIIVATDDFGNSDSCSQFIHVYNASPLTTEGIIWPDGVELDTCAYDLSDVLFDEPQWITGHCSMVSYSYEDELFDISEDACAKIRRSFFLIDWCQYDANTGAGLWSGEQIIKINNFVGPSFDDACDTLTLCILEESCGQVFEFEVSATDDCTHENQLNYSYEIDIDHDGVFDIFGTGNQIEQYFEPTEAVIKWIVDDRCGNTTSCKQIVIVEDCKLPSPYCLSSVTAVIDIFGDAEIWVSDVDLGGADNCTSQVNLLVSFSDTMQLDVLHFNCEDIPNGVETSIMIDLWYTDEAGNQEFCTTELILQDSGDICENESFTGSISGTISTIADQMLDQVNVQLHSFPDEGSQNTLSENGLFAFDELNSEFSYQLSFEREDSYLSGVSTLDIIRIQNHVLGSIPLATAYQVLAADVDASGTVSAIDLVTIRKLILGKIESFPNQDQSWVFVERDDELASVNPWFLLDAVDFILEDVNSNLDIRAIKLGDVNNSASTNFHDISQENRSSYQISYDSYFKNNQYYIELFSNGELSIEGFQLNLDIDENVSLLNIESERFRDFSSDNFHLDNQDLRISYSNAEAEKLEGQAKLLTLIFDSETNIDLAHVIQNAFYVEDKTQIINGLSRMDGVKTSNCVTALTWNQSTHTLHYKLNESLEYLDVRLYDLQGRLICDSKHTNPELTGFIEIPRESPILTGIYLLQYNTNLCSETEQIFLSGE